MIAFRKTAAFVGICASLFAALALASANAQWKLTPEQRRDPEISAWLNEVTPEELDALRSEMRSGSSINSIDVTRAFEARYRQRLSYGELARKLLDHGFRPWAGSGHQADLLSGQPADNWFISYYRHVGRLLSEKGFSNQSVGDDGASSRSRGNRTPVASGGQHLARWHLRGWEVGKLDQ